MEEIILASASPRRAELLRRMGVPFSVRPAQVDEEVSGEPEACVRAVIHFADLTKEEIAEYVATGEPMDKAGAYGIQGLGGALVRRIEGDYYATVGLSLFGLRALLREAGLR